VKPALLRPYIGTAVPSSPSSRQKRSHFLATLGKFWCVDSPKSSSRSAFFIHRRVEAPEYFDLWAGISCKVATPAAIRGQL
jgi:hypothetical protein